MTKSASPKSSEQAATAKPENPYATRETVESIVIAVILAFLFRTFVAEAFVIPTGSMAPTLEGSHKDVACDQCGYQYQAGASCENEESGRNELVVASTCPICRYTMPMELATRSEHGSFTGDRILVSKYAYDIAEPKRWDIIVFKYPNNAKQNYIKRLVGLPGETLHIRHGDLYVQQGASEVEIARKPPHKIKAMLQLVDDTNYLAAKLKEVKWPSRWQPWPAPAGEPVVARSCVDDVGGITLDGDAAEESSVRYRHIIPSHQDWLDLEDGAEDVMGRQSRNGELIADFYAYNAQASRPRDAIRTDVSNGEELGPDLKALGLHWVGDLALETDVDIQSQTGELILDLVEGGVHFQCRIDVATGQATLSTHAVKPDSIEQVTFGSATAPAARSPQAATPVRGGKRHHLRFSNLDDELRLWVDEHVMEFDQPTTYIRSAPAKPVWTAHDPGDLAPAGVATKGAKVHFQRLRVLRDVYYIATDYKLSDRFRFDAQGDSDYDARVRYDEIRKILGQPQQWDSTNLFDARRSVEFQLGDGQFFPLGDNSPQSKDGRLWGEPAYVERELLTGKAVFVYWPHPLPKPIPFTPNLFRMRLIR